MITHPIEKVEAIIKKKDGYFTEEEANKISRKIMDLLAPLHKENKYDIETGFDTTKTSTEIP